MKKMLFTLLALTTFSSTAFAGGALICTSDSTGKCKGRSYCCYSGSESDGDKYCKSLGCVRGGTSSCPSAANVSSCGTRDHASSAEGLEQRSELDLPWCIDPKDAQPI